ncbi:MAG: hypothetical protein WC600_16555 [Desulfobaccales bacterium]
MRINEFQAAWATAHNVGLMFCPRHTDNDYRAARGESGGPEAEKIDLCSRPDQRYSSRP